MWELGKYSPLLQASPLFFWCGIKNVKKGLVVSNKTIIYLVQKVTMNLGSIKYVFSDLDFNEIANPRGLPIGSCLGRAK